MTSREPASIFAALKNAKRLPTPPGTAVRVLELCRSEDSDIHRIADVIMSDPALSARLLKFANSPLAGLTRKVTSVRDAVKLLGLRSVKLTTLGFSIAPSGNEVACPGFDIKQFWATSFLRAVTARRLARECPRVDKEETFTAALLVGIGQMALAKGAADVYAPVLAEAKNGAPLAEVEQRALGMTSAEFGAELLHEWALPDELVNVVREQAKPIDISPLSKACTIGNIVSTASLVVTHLSGKLSESTSQKENPLPVLEPYLGDAEGAWAAFVEDILADWREVAGMFDLKLESQGEIMDLYAEAQEQATKVGMAAQLEQAKTLLDNAELLRKATTDPLTGIGNRARFDERLEELLKAARRGHGEFALILLDIDHFKKFNDTYGHPTGDAVLKEVAQAIKIALREVDLVARYGGEEFAVLAPHTDRKDACTVTARLRKAVEDLTVPAVDKALKVTVSLGLAHCGDYASRPTANQLIKDADQQLYLSKKAGRNTWSYLGKTAPQLPAKVTAGGIDKPKAAAIPVMKPVLAATVAS